MLSLEKRKWQWAAMIFLAFVWGASFILMKKGLTALTYIQVAALRITISYVVLIPFAIINLKKLTVKNAVILMACGLLGNFFPAFLFTLSETRIDSSLAGILNGLTPFFTLIIGILFFGNKPSLKQYAGIFIGFIGASVLVTNGNLSSLYSIDVFALLVILATLMYGINTNLIKYRLADLNGVEITSLVFFMIGPFSLLILFFTDFNTGSSTDLIYQSLAATALLALFGSVVSLFIFNNLVHRTGAVFASSVTYIIPFFSLLWGLLDGEPITLIHLLSLLIILFGVYLTSIQVNGRLKPYFELLKNKIASNNK